MQGDVIAIVDKDAQTVARYSYDAWGAITSAVTYTELTENVDIATINPFRYRGYYYDEEIGLYYLQSRYYNANISKFINSDDSIILLLYARYRPFTYCKNNPSNNIDPSGYFDESLYGFKWFNGGKKYGKGFTINVSSVFRKKSYCLKYAKDFLDEYGSGWLIKKYDGMDKTRIAAEIWFHVAVYYIGNASYLASVLRANIKTVNDIIKSTNPITVNSKDNRSCFFWLAWFGIPESKLRFKKEYITC